MERGPDSSRTTSTVRCRPELDGIERLFDDGRMLDVAIRKPDGKLGTIILGTIKAVKDPCKDLKIGRCGGT